MLLLDGQNQGCDTGNDCRDRATTTLMSAAAATVMLGVACGVPCVVSWDGRRTSNREGGSRLSISRVVVGSAVVPLVCATSSFISTSSSSLSAADGFVLTAHGGYCLKR